MTELSQAAVGYYGYLIVIVLMMIGLYIVIAHGNLIKKLIGLSLFQGSAFVLFILLAAHEDAAPPILDMAAAAGSAYANPLPHVLILTAIVVSIATMALGLSLTLRINSAWGTLEEEEITPRRDEGD